jgi:hypothetical protein
MRLDLQFKIRSNPDYQRYLRSHSYWYKILNRNPNIFKSFEDELKQQYKLRKIDRLGRTLETVEMLTSLMASFK